MGNCHCRDCQRSTGGAYAPMLGVPAPALKINGHMKFYESRANSGNVVTRGFCSNCGGRVFANSTGYPTIIEIYAGTLDNPSIFKPAEDIYTSSAQPWDFMNPQLRKFAKQPAS
jgi:hypothetical protein